MFSLRPFLLIFSLLSMLQITVYAQISTRLDKGWHFLKSDLGGVWESVRPYSKGSPEAVPIWENVDLPHCYNATDAVDPKENYYQGPTWYKKNIDVDNPYQHGRTVLHFEGVGQKAEVYVYTTKVGEHVGGYDEWSIDITDAVADFKKTEVYSKQFKGKIPISIRVDNSRDLEIIPSDLSDFNLYGGIYRNVNLRYNPALSLANLHARASVDVDGKEGKVDISAQLLNFSEESTAIAEIKLLDPTGKVVRGSESIITNLEGTVSLGDITLKKPKLWSPEHPQLYRLITTIRSGQEIYKHEERIGFRHFEFKESGPFFLNGQRLLLKGTHRHEDHAGVGAAMSEQVIRQEMKLIKDMGVNFIRLGHYQQSRSVLEACDSLGILVWEEIPWCRGGLGGEQYKEQARRMLTNMINQHYNYTSIIIWGLGNENDWAGDFAAFEQEAIRSFMKELNELSHDLDPFRKTAIRRCDFCKDIVDIYSPSIWAGWYRGAYTDYKASSEEEMRKVKHFLHVEWGGDSHAGRHSENPDKVLAEIKTGQGTDERAGDASLYGGSARVSKDGDWSESYICNLIDWHLKEQETMPWLTGTAFWVFKDFSTPVRPDNPVPYVNQKGVVERDLTTKEAYYVFQSYWSEKPMIHLYGHSWPVRSGEAGEKKMIKVYSNLKEVELFVNGSSMGVKKRNSANFPAAGLYWMVELKEGENYIQAVGRSEQQTLRDEIVQSYQLAGWGSPTDMQLISSVEDDDKAVVEVIFKDESGKICLDAKNWVEFGLLGDGELIDNQGTSEGSRLVQLYNGRARIHLKRHSGENIISVYSKGLGRKFITVN